MAMFSGIVKVDAAICNSVVGAAATLIKPISGDGLAAIVRAVLMA